MNSKTILPWFCIAVALISFSLPFWLLEAKAEIIQDHPIPSALGAYCKNTGSCSNLLTGCQPRTMTCPGGQVCPLILPTTLNPKGACTNGGTSDCPQYAPFWCAEVDYYSDALGTGLCYSYNYRCTVIFGEPQGCEP